MQDCKLAIEGGPPVRRHKLPYGRQSISSEDAQAVVAALQSDWLTTGPAVAAFEDAFCAYTGASHAVAVSSGTAALHACAAGLGWAPGDEVIVTPMTFAASANCVVYQGAKPVFADVEPDTLLLDPASVEEKIGPRTRAIVAVDYAGQACDYERLKALARRHSLALVADSCHAVGARQRERAAGTFADLNCFSFHPVKHFTTGEGGMVTTESGELADQLRVFRNHGITSDHRQREATGTFYYEMVELGFNYRITDFQCALGRSQLRRVEEWVARRRELAGRFRDALGRLPAICNLAERPWNRHAYHLFVVQLELPALRADRNTILAALLAEGIGCNVHYIPVHFHPFYRRRFGTAEGLCPKAEAAYQRILTIPLFPAMNDRDVQDVVDAMEKVLTHFAR